MRRIGCLLACILVTFSSFGQSLLVNEVVSRNSLSLVDDDGDSSDWIELYNASGQALDLEGYGLSDDLDNLLKWSFSNQVLEAGEFLIVFASGKDRHSPAGAHTNFKLSGDGENLILTTALEVTLDQVTIPALMADEAYARIRDGANDWWISSMLTPGSSNVGNQLYFSHAEGAYEEPFNLLVDGVFADTIFFTRDGSAPSSSSELFQDSMRIDSRSGDVNTFADQLKDSPASELHKCHALRFASFRNGLRSSPVYTKTYFADGLLQDRYSVPVVSLMSDPSGFTSFDTGIYVPGVNFDEENPIWTGNYFMRGEDWEREMHLSYFDLDSRPVISQYAGLRIHGEKTRQAGQKSFRLYARSEYGKKEFDHRFFQERTHESYKRLVLRTSVGAWGEPTIINEGLAHDIVRGLDFESQTSRPTVVYLNGEYWGLYTLIDRIDERYIAYENNIDVDSVFYLGLESTGIR